MTNKTPETQQKDGVVEITYREDGEIPILIWIVWLGFAAFAAYYIAKWALPDFWVWWREAKF